jgi:hypothetical protein
MSIEQRTRALMVRHQHMINNRQECMLSRMAATVGLPNEVVEEWSRHQGKTRPEHAELNGKSVGVS